MNVSEQFLRSAARLLRDHRSDSDLDNAAWTELMHEMRGRIAQGLDELEVDDYPPSLGPEHKILVDAVLEWIRSLLRHGEL